MNKRSGFTLIELLVVIGIIALLISIMMPSLSEVRRQSKRTVCLGNLQQIGTAIRAYLHNNRDTFDIRISRLPAYPPPPPVPPIIPEPSARTLPQMLKRELAAAGSQRTAQGDEAKYINKVFECPADKITDPSVLADPLVGGAASRYFDSQSTSYEWNERLNNVTMNNKKQIKVLEYYKDASGVVQKREIYIPTKNLDMVKDFDAFHGTPNQRGTLNVLYADFALRSL